MKNEDLIDELSKGRFKMDEYAFREIRHILRKSEVTEDFVEKWADVIHQADTGLFGIKGELKLVRQMLKEAGVRVA